MTAPDQLSLDVPIEEAVLFALGLTDLHVDKPTNRARQLIGLIALDQLEYYEQWRDSAIVRKALKKKWPELNL
jgi:hypothetical protein